MKLPPPRIDLRGLKAVKVGVSRFSLGDPYYLVLAMRWPTFIASVLLVFLVANLAFAGLYWLAPGSVANAHPGAFGDAFFFSVETLATVGYGVMTPASTYGHMVATAEIFVGMFLTALATGAFFARFARPQSRLVFSEVGVIAPYEGRQALMVRVASRRLQGISEPRARISYLRDQAVGELRFRRFDELKLVRDNIPVLSLSWTLIHPIDEDSPLFGMSDARLAAEAPTLMVSVAGFDEAISSTVNDRKTYDPEDIRFGHVFTNILRDLPGGFVELDITRIHETTPIETPDQESAVRAS
ncbi:MAG: Inward rectifier potassium channel [Phenylobacterium sp.]|uniref:ion channel n=1 Tax=Phenylobacterium sp. TaxID=1871053 RepID=UPI0026193609|nr:ion channel [Phenylobacterium sp.]MDB5499991.1 Inward rectifier potassium channel [Phenylobacterium sp.]